MASQMVADACEMLGGNGILLEYQVAPHHADIGGVFTYARTDTIQ
jgi:glutaryl-CoA dehydrogenase